LKPVFQFSIKVYEKQKMSGLQKELKYLADIKGVYVYVTEAVTIHT
jgi:hypothetical protein